MWISTGGNRENREKNPLCFLCFLLFEFLRKPKIHARRPLSYNWLRVDSFRQEKSLQPARGASPPCTGEVNTLESRMKIVHYPHPSLRHVAQPLHAIDKKVHLVVGE